MAEKNTVTFQLDEEVSREFVRAANIKGYLPEDLLEEFMRYYVNESDDEPDELEESDELDDEVNWTTILLDKFANKKVGELANHVLRELIERGVATEEEIAEFQKASGNVPQKDYHVPFGKYVRDEFGTTFPLLINEQRWKDYDRTKKTPKYLVQPLYVNGEKFYLCAQWFINNRAPMENWIRKRLPLWLKQTDAKSRAYMINWIKSL